MSAGIGRWLSSRHVGASSSALAAAMLGHVPTESAPAHPLDVGDFGRCAKLWAEVEPEEAQYGLRKLADVSAPWRRLAGSWDDLLKLYETDRDQCDKLVRGLTNSFQGSGMYEVRKDADGRWDKFKVA